MALRLRTLVIVFGIIAAGSLAVTFLSYAASWTAPAGGPPGNNVDAPVNVGPDAQAKIGDFAVANPTTNNAAFDADVVSAGRAYVFGEAKFFEGLDVSGLDSLPRIITGVANPVADADAVNKGYLSAQVSGAKADNMIVFSSGPDGAFPSCPSQYPHSLYTGYGPHWIGVYASAAVALTEAGYPAPAGDTVTAAFASDSICSKSRFTAVNISFLGMPSTWIANAPRRADACAPDYDLAGNLTGSQTCNLCRVCSTIAP